MISPSILRIEPLHRPGTTSENGTYTTERWSWDFVVDGNSLWSLWKDSDVIGVLGWSDSAIEELSIAKLLGNVESDLPPNRVALFVCPECGDLGCGAITTALERQGEFIIWSDFRWEVDYDEGSTQKYDVGPFRFYYSDYSSALNEARSRRLTR